MGFAGFAGKKPPEFMNESERRVAQVIDDAGLRWSYEPTTFVFERKPNGSIHRAFTPDFYLVDWNLYVEITTSRSATAKNRKARELKEHYPEVKLEVLYRKDVEEFLASHAADAT